MIEIVGGLIVVGLFIGLCVLFSVVCFWALDKALSNDVD